MQKKKWEREGLGALIIQCLLKTEGGREEGREGGGRGREGGRGVREGGRGGGREGGGDLNIKAISCIVCPSARVLNACGVENLATACCLEHL